MTKIAVYVAGCKVNQVEADLLRSRFEDAGWTAAEAGEDADLVVVHTCTVTARADRDSRRLVARAHAQQPHAAIAVSGCLAEMEAETLHSLPGVKAVIPQAKRHQAVQIASRIVHGGPAPAADDLEPGFFPGPSGVRGGRARAQIKIQDGCNGACTYCRVRLARGRSVSRPLPEILREAEALLAAGHRELVLVGVNLGAWQPGLAVLIPALTALPGVFRVRLSSLEPQHLTAELMQAMARAGRKLCPHLHLPVQSGDDGVLRAMGRAYSVEDLRQKLAALKRMIPEIVLTADVITGFPGEGLEAFENTQRLVRACAFTRLHVFPYSARPGTAAAGFAAQVPGREINRRARELRALSREMNRRYRGLLPGRLTWVLLEGRGATGEWTGTTETYQKARLFHSGGQAGQLVPGRILSANAEEVLVE